MRHILGRPLKDEDLVVDEDKLVKENIEEISALLAILLRESFIIPGPLEGGNCVYLLVQMGIDPPTLEQVQSSFRT